MACSDNFEGLQLKGVTELNRELERGAYGKVYAVKYCQTICAAKEIHSILVEGVGHEGSDTFGNLVHLLRNHWKSLQKSLEIRKSGFTPEILNEIKS